MRRTFALALTIALVTPGVASAFGPGGHFGAAEDSWDQVTQLPANAALEGDAVARRCFLYGANLPDLAWIHQRLPLFQAIVDRARRVSAVKKVDLDLTDVGPFDIPHHDTRFLLHLVDEARATGSKELLAFALGALSHIAGDHEEETFAMLRTPLEAHAGDLGLAAEATGDPARYTERDECELLVSFLRERAQSSDRLRRLRDLPRELAKGGFLGLHRTARSLALRTRLVAFYYDVARRSALAANPSAQVISARGVLNCAALMEAAWVLEPAVMNRVSFAETARVFKSRYVDLKWWADVLVGLGQVLSRSLTLGTQGVYDVASLVLRPRRFIGPALAGADDPLQEVLVASVFGGDVWRDVERRYAGLTEFQRIVRGDMLDADRQATTAITRTIFVDLARRGLASRWVDWVDPYGLTMRGVAHQAFLLGPPGLAAPGSHEARAAGFVVADLRWRDAATGAELTEVSATDQGRRVRAEVTLQGLNPAAATLYGGAPQAFEVAIVEDAATGPDRDLARASTSLPAADLDPLRLSDRALPVLSVEAALPLAQGTRGYHVEVRYEGQRVFTTDLEVLAAHGATQVQYRTHYASYGSTRRISGLPIR
jgi:hypothetical protein